MTDVFVAEAHPHYVVMVDGQIYDEMTSQPGHPPLTWSQMTDVAHGYEEALTVNPDPIAKHRRDQRRAHRAVDGWYTACAKRLSVLWLDIPLSQTDPKDRCKTCWPEAPS